MCDPVTIYLTLHLRKPTAHFRVVPSEVTGLSQGHGQSLEVFRNISLREACRTRNPLFEIPRVAENLYLGRCADVFARTKGHTEAGDYFGDLRAAAVGDKGAR